MNAIFSAVQQRVLGLLFREPDREFSTSELIRLAGSGTGAVHRELIRLAESGLVTVRSLGNQRRYRVNRDSPIFDELHGIVLKTVGLIGPLAEALSKLEDRIQAAFVYGSVAKGADDTKSDIDLMVIGDDLTYAEVFAAVHETERRLGRPINPSLMSVEEWHRKVKGGSSFAVRVGGQPKLFVIGSEDDLRAA